MVTSVNNKSGLYMKMDKRIMNIQLMTRLANEKCTLYFPCSMDENMLCISVHATIFKNHMIASGFKVDVLYVCDNKTKKCQQ